MRPPLSLVPAAACCVASAALAGPAAGAGGGPGGDPARLAGAARAFVETACGDCHGEWVREGGLSFAGLSGDPADPAARRLWERAHDRLLAGEMPPPADAALSPADRAAGAAALAAWLSAGDAGHARRAGRAGVRRLNRAEYEAALRDLLELPDLSVRDLLPPDGAADGFAKGDAALDFPPALLEGLLNAAGEALNQAVDYRERPPEPKTVRVTVAHDGPDLSELEDRAGGLFGRLHVGTAWPILGDGPATVRRDPTLDVEMWDFATGHDGHVRDPAPHFGGVGFVEGKADDTWLAGLRTAEAGRYRVRMNGFAFRTRSGRAVPADEPAIVRFLTHEAPIGAVTVPHDRCGTVEAEGRVGSNKTLKFSVGTAAIRRLAYWEGVTPDTRDLPGVVFRWVELEGPLVDEWPPAGHRVLFGDDAVGRPDPADPAAETRRLVRRFLRRALRRPVTDADLAPPLAAARSQRDAGAPFAESLLAAYRAVLCSPDFLLVAADVRPGGESDDRGGPLTDHALAERLALFLTNGLPDGPLRAAAAGGALADPDVLAGHAGRLLDSPRSGRFVEHFTDWWLDLRRFDLTAPDPNLYPEWTPLLDAAVREEPRRFFALMLAEDLPAAAVIDSDLAVLNGPLATLYGVPGVAGAEWRTVALPADSPRGGLLTTAAVLKVTANGTTTSPVTRGMFVAERLLHDPPPPPPPDVPAVEPDIRGAATVRQLLEKHRADPACAGCHAKIDPPGFALERFDVIGAWRDRYRVLGGGEGEEEDRPDPSARYDGPMDRDGLPAVWRPGPAVDAAGALPTGAAFDGPAGFKAALLADDRAVARALLAHLVTYATGTPVRFGDRAAVEEILDGCEPGGYGTRSLALALVRSPLFRRR